MWTPGLLYVDKEGGYLSWCGLYLKTVSHKGLLSGTELWWSWTIGSGEYLHDYEDIDNYYGRREATPEETEKIWNLYKFLKSKQHTTLYILIDVNKIPVYVSLSEDDALKNMKEGLRLKKKIIKTNELL